MLQGRTKIKRKAHLEENLSLSNLPVVIFSQAGEDYLLTGSPEVFLEQENEIIMYKIS